MLRHVVFNGVCGSGKTHCCNQMIRLLYYVCVCIHSGSLCDVELVGCSFARRLLEGALENCFFNLSFPVFVPILVV